MTIFLFIFCIRANCLLITHATSKFPSTARRTLSLLWHTTSAGWLIGDRRYSLYFPRFTLSPFFLSFSPWVCYSSRRCTILPFRCAALALNPLLSSPLHMQLLHRHTFAALSSPVLLFSLSILLCWWYTLHWLTGLLLFARRRSLSPSSAHTATDWRDNGTAARRDVDWIVDLLATDTDDCRRVGERCRESAGVGALVRSWFLLSVFLFLFGYSRASQIGPDCGHAVCLEVKRQ